MCLGTRSEGLWTQVHITKKGDHPSGGHSFWKERGVEEGGLAKGKAKKCPGYTKYIRYIWFVEKERHTMRE